MMLPKGVDPRPVPALDDYWSRGFKGATPELRMARAHNKTMQRIRAIYTRPIREAVEPIVEEPGVSMDYVVTEWAKVWGSERLLAEQEAWNAGLRELSRDLGDCGIHVHTGGNPQGAPGRQRCPPAGFFCRGLQDSTTAAPGLILG